MKKKETKIASYICDKCGKEFPTQAQCAQHEKLGHVRVAVFRLKLGYDAFEEDYEMGASCTLRSMEEARREYGEHKPGEVWRMLSEDGDMEIYCLVVCRAAAAMRAACKRAVVHWFKTQVDSSIDDISEARLGDE